MNLGRLLHATWVSAPGFVIGSLFTAAVYRLRGYRLREIVQDHDA